MAGKSHSPELRLAALAMVAAGANHSETARKLGISPSTVSQWVAEEEARRTKTDGPRNVGVRKHKKTPGSGVIAGPVFRRGYVFPGPR